MKQARLASCNFIQHTLLLVASFAMCGGAAHGDVLREATYDTDSYVFVGTNSQTDAGITIGTDYSGGIVDAANVHFNFGVIKFDDLTGIETKANGGPDKFLKLSISTFPGPAEIGVSAAAGDVESSYPSFMFAGNPAGDELDRQQWFIDHIKGDDANYGGYAGGAAHLGVFDVDAPGTYFLEVTSVVDSWINGAGPNYGFGLWGLNVSGGQGDPFDFASIENASAPGPALVNAIPEPATVTMTALAVLLTSLGLQCRRNRNDSR